MTVGICGLGLIGGSMAKAYKSANHTVLGFDTNSASLGYASLAGIIDGVLDDSNASSCDLIFIALYPKAAAEYLLKIAPAVSNTETVVMDLCGTKKGICEIGFDLAKKYNFVFVGGHPMAGTQYSGIKYAKETLFKGAPMVIVPPIKDDIYFLERVKKLLAPAMFGRITVTTADEHDAMIAFTSQLSHVIASSYIKSPSAERQGGFAGGTYRDMTRVAYLNAPMWSEIFISNKDCLLAEIDSLIDNMSKYRKAISEENVDELRELLEEGSRRKEKLG
jgi:prephenate dehydrogenase